nr:unnamed protein product [Digitaria exilis]
MHAAVQSGGQSPKQLNGPSASQQLKTAPDGTQNCGLSKGKKRERGEQGIDLVKRDRDRLLVDDSESGSKLDDMKSEIAKIEKGGLPNAEAVEKLVRLMQRDQTEQRMDFAGRIMLADVIAATENPDCLGRFVESRGLSVLDSWLQEAHKGKSGDGSSSKETDKPIDDLLLALLRALAKLPINLSALQSCSIGKSVNHLRSHKSLEIQKKAKFLVENWKKRVDAEMKSNDTKPLVSGQSASWPGKAGFQEISNAGNKRGGSSEHSPKNQASTVSSPKVLTDKPGSADAVVKLNHVVSVSTKVQHMQTGNVATNSKDQPSKSTGGSELPTVKEEKSSSSSQSPNDSQSCSSEPSKDARSSTAASGGASKTSGSSSRGHRRANNGIASENLKGASVARSASLDRPDKSSQTGTASEKRVDIQSEHGNNHRLIVRFPNPGRSPARSASGGSFEDPSVTGGTASSPMVADRHDQIDRRVRMKTESSRPHLASDANTESWHSNDIKGSAGSDEGCAMLDDDNRRTPDDSGEDRDACAAHGKIKGGCTDKDGAVESGVVGSNRNSSLILAMESSLPSAGKQAQGLLKPTNHKQPVGVLDKPGGFDGCDSTVGTLDLMAADEEVKKTDAVGDSSTMQKEDEKNEPSSSLADVPKLDVAAASPLGGASMIKKMDGSKDSSSESSGHVKSEGINFQKNERSSKQCSKKSDDGVSGKEDGKELVSSGEVSSPAPHAKSSATARLDFDLNEGIPGDDGHQSDPTISPVICSSAIHVAGILPFSSPVTNGLQPAPITVAAPVKGPFVPPENLLRAKPETGWKGSAATSAFRPAEPRMVLEVSLTTHDILGSDVAEKQSRPTLGFDLNVADDQALEDDVPQSSAQTTCSESGNNRSRDGSSRSGGIELDLNRADEVAENGQFAPNTSHRVEVPRLPVRPLPGVFSNTGMSISRDFDLNNGPGLDEAGTEPAPKNPPAKSTSSIQFLPQVPGVRMNNATMSNMSPWFASANPCGPVTIQSFLPARGEQPYPIELTPGTQRIVPPTADGGQFRGDPSRAPVISTAPTVVFHPPAYPYAGFPFPPSVHLQTPGFSIGSTAFGNSVPAGMPYFPSISPSLVGPTGALPAQHSRQYAINLPEGSSSSGRDSNHKWDSQVLDLNSGPGSIDIEGKDERLPLPSRQNLISAPNAFTDEQGRIYQIPGVGTKRKEPDGSWDTERSTYKQLPWQ